MDEEQQSDGVARSSLLNNVYCLSVTRWHYCRAARWQSHLSPPPFRRWAPLEGDSGNKSRQNKGSLGVQEALQLEQEMEPQHWTALMKEGTHSFGFIYLVLFHSANKCWSISLASLHLPTGAKFVFKKKTHFKTSIVLEMHLSDSRRPFYRSLFSLHPPPPFPLLQVSVSLFLFFNKLLRGTPHHLSLCVLLPWQQGH